MAKKQVVLIRHGQIPGNVEKRYIGCRTDESLTEHGIEEILARRAEAGKLLSGGVVRICCSPMKRAVETVYYLFDEKAPTILTDLREMDFGNFEGKNYEDLSGDKDYQSWIDSGGTKDFPGGEKRDAFIHRSMQGFRAALGDIEISERVIILCHGGTIMAIMSALTGKDTYDFMVGNLEGYILDLEMNDEGIHVISYNRLVFGRSA